MLQLDNGSCACSACRHYLALKELCRSSLVHFVSFANCGGILFRLPIAGEETSSSIERRSVMSHSRATLQVKVFAWLPLGSQLFWFRETSLQSKSPAPKFQVPW